LDFVLRTMYPHLITRLAGATMSIKIPCPSCGRQYTLQDHMQGKTIKCGSCATAFKVETVDDPPEPPQAIRASSSPLPSAPRRRPMDDDDDTPRPRRRRTRDDDEDNRSHRGRQGGNGLLIGIIAGSIGAVVLVCLVGGIAAFLVFDSTPAVRPPVPPAPPIAQEQIVQPPVQGKDIPPAIQKPQPKIDEKPGQQPNPFKNQDPIKPPLPKVDPAKPPVVPPAVWKVAVDPGPDMTRPPANPQARFDLLNSPQVVVPTSPSPYLALRHGSGDKEGWQVLDLQKLEALATVSGRPQFDAESLSVDGQHMVGRGHNPPRGTITAAVLSVAKGQFVQNVAMSINGFGYGWMDFADNKHILTAKNREGRTFFEVWNIESGQPVRQFDTANVGDRRLCVSFSPGRKYLALALNDRVQIIEILSGETCGELPYPNNIEFHKYGSRGMAFSPDGAELAIYLEKFPGQAQFLSYDVATGQAAVHHQFARQLSPLLGSSFGFQGLALEWLPDRGGWLFRGQLLIDHQSGALVYKIEGNEDSKRFPRRMLGTDHVALVTAGRQTNSVTYMSLPRAEIAVAVKKARSGGGVAPSELPPARTGDVAGIKALPQPVGNVPWKVAADSAPAPKQRLAPQPVRLSGTPQDIIQIAFSRGVEPQAVVTSVVLPNLLSPMKNVRAERFDLGTGQLRDSVDLFSVDEKRKGGQPIANTKVDVNADGSRIVVRHPDDLRRLDVWSLTDGKHLVGWLPFDGAFTVDSFAFIDNEHVLTYGQGRIVLWQVPECRAVYTVDGYGSAPHLSANRKHFAALTGATLEIVAAASGERLGQLDQPGGPVSSVHTVAFSHDGKEIAACLTLTATPGNQLARWNLSDASWQGNVGAAFNNLVLLVAGPKHVLHGQTLYDWNLKAPLWQYTLGGAHHHATASPDGRHWYAFQASGQVNGTLLTAQALPDPQASILAAQISNGEVKSIAPPGSNVAVNINTAEARFRTEVEKALTERLQKAGYTVGAGGISVAVSAESKQTGKTIDFQIRRGSPFGGPLPPFGPIGPFGPMGGPVGPMVSINEMEIRCQATFNDAKGQQLHKVDLPIRTPSSISVRSGNYQQELDEATWNNAINWGRALSLPTNFYNINGQVQALPKTGPLTAGG